MSSNYCWTTFFFLLFSTTPLPCRCKISIKLSYPFRIHDLVGVSGGTCIHRLFVSELVSENFFAPSFPVELFDWQLIIRNTNHYSTNSNPINVYKSVPKIRAECLITVHFIQKPYTIHELLLKELNVTTEAQQLIVKANLFKLTEFIDKLWINLPSWQETIKINLHEQFSFVILSYDRIYDHTDGFAAILKSRISLVTFYTFVVVIIEQLHFGGQCYFISSPTVKNMRKEVDFCENYVYLYFDLNWMKSVKKHDGLWFLAEDFKNFKPQILGFGKRQNVLLNHLRAHRSFLQLSVAEKGKLLDTHFEIVSPVLNVVYSYILSEICARINNTAVPSSHWDIIRGITPPVSNPDFYFNGNYKNTFVEKYSNARGVSFEQYWAISCHREDVMSFEIYLNPFQPGLWITLSLTGICVCLLWKTYNWVLQLTGSCKPVLFLFASVVNNSTAEPQSLKSSFPFRVSWVPWVLMSILLNNCYISIIVSYINSPHSGEPIKNFSAILCDKNDGHESFRNFSPPFQYIPGDEYYKINTLLFMAKVALSSQIRVSERYEDKSDYNKAVNFWMPAKQYEHLFPMMDNQQHSIFWKHYQSVIPANSKINMTKYASDYSCFALLSPPIWRGMDVAAGSSQSSELLHILLSLWRESTGKQEKYISRFLNPKLRYTPEMSTRKARKLGTIEFYNKPYFGNYTMNLYRKFVQEAAIEEELTECKKSVYIADTDSIEDEFKYLTQNYPNLNFYKSKVPLFQRINGWGFDHSKRYEKLPKYIQMYHGETGLYNHYQMLERGSGHIYRNNYTQSLNKARRISPIKLGSPLQTVFTIIIVGLLLSFMLFIIEWLNYTRNTSWVLATITAFTLRQQSI